jgi:outer membrane protein, heavy metal efflux system
VFRDKFATEAALICGVACVISVVPPAAYAQQSLLTRADAIARALADDPRIDALEASEEAAEANLRQARRWTNPTLDVLQENVEGSGPFRGSERAETTYSLRQPLQLGGDYSARRGIAARERDMARIGAGLQRLDLIAEIEHAFVDAQAAEAARVVAEERLGVARDLASTVSRRVQAARDPFMAGSRAQARLAEAEIEAEAAQRGALAARARLASYWGGAGDFALDMASFAHLVDTTNVRQAPDLALAEAQAERARAQLRLERAQSIPDVELQAGWREFSETDETAIVFGLSVPLQLWNRNADAVTRARAESARAEHQRAAFERALARDAARLQAELDTARLEVEGLDARVIPASQEALNFARTGYERGAFSYIDVLEAQRSLAEARLRRIEALRSFHRAEVSLARLSGARVEEIAQ